jgi:hypothetical protein
MDTLSAMNWESSPRPWDYHHIKPTYKTRTETPDGSRQLAVGLSIVIFLLGLSILGIVVSRWWKYSHSRLQYWYDGPDDRLRGLFSASDSERNGYPIFENRDAAGGCVYLYHGSVTPDRSLWILSTSLDEGDDTSHLAYASGPRGHLETLVITGGRHHGIKGGRMRVT